MARTPWRGLAQTSGAVGPLAVAALALALRPSEAAVSAPPEPPARAAPAAAAPAGDLPPPPPNSVPAGCLDRFQLVLPVNEGDGAGRTTLICRRGYVLAFNVDRHNPDWVMERLAAADLTGPAQRSNRFGHDPAAQGTDAGNPDYTGTGYDRGHQAPAGDAKFNQTIMDQSFFFTNMAPQVGVGFNRGAWKFLEENVRGWVQCGGHEELYVITGPIYGNNPATIGATRVAVPREFFKIVYDPNSGRAVGFVLPNTRIGSRIDLQLYVRPISEIESSTGLDFFSSFSERQQALLERSPGTAWGHNNTCPGDGGD